MKEMQDQELIIIEDAVEVQSAKVESILCLIVSCKSHEHYNRLPAALSYKGIVCGKAGCNAGKREAYYKSNDDVAYSIKL